ncbi:MAG: NUDIX hydrolase, partial [Saprospiraceae bacterium]|nr:NUDIX hydrolase [Saprospiraceae bacterium]
LGTDPLDSAQRELREETGIIAKEWTKVQELHTSNSVCDEKGIIYIARELHFGPSSPEETEKLMVKRVKLSEAIAMVLSGEITDAISIIGLLLAGRIENQ